MLVYAIIVTIITVILIVKMFKWKVAFHSITLFCVENFREPTDKEIADCSKRTISKMLMTATPDPNKYKELIHYAGYLEIMDTGQALTRFFQRDSTKANKLTIYPHKEKVDAISVKENLTTVNKPETFLKSIITPLQLNPVEFTQMSKADQNRAILDLIEFDWDMDWICEKFGEIPQGVDYSQNILQILNDIQSDKGAYFLSRQDINREIRHKLAFISDIAKDIPDGYQAEKWRNYDLSAKYTELMKRRDKNGKIERAKAFRDSYNNKLRGLEANREIAVSAASQAIATERDNLNRLIAEREAEICAARDKLASLDAKFEDKKKIAQSEFETAKAKLDKDTGVAEQFMNLTPEPTEELAEEIKTAEAMMKHLNEYDRMSAMRSELEGLKAKSDEYTEKIELARSLPAEILETATLPIEGLTVRDGIPLIHGLPVSNRSDGEKLELCVDIAVHNPSGLKIILIDGAEKLDDDSRERLYTKCREKGVQFIATRTTNDNELIVTEL